MSSILEALKKVEAETASETAIEPPGGVVNTRKVFTARAKRNGQKKIAKRITAAGLLLVILLGGGYLTHKLWSQKTPHPHLSQPIRTVTPQALKPKPAEPKPQSATPAPLTNPQPVKKNTPVKQQAPLTSVSPLSPQPAESASQKAPAFIAQKDNPSRSPAQPPIKTADASRYQLQAIAWSPEPGERMAVVNGSIVKEGESVAGLTVTRIMPEVIILSDGINRWRLPFRPSGFH